MGKVIAIVGVLLFVWVMAPHFARGEWIAPTPLPPTWWGITPENQALAMPPAGYGWFGFDFWHDTPVQGRPVYQSDFRL